METTFLYAAAASAIGAFVGYGLVQLFMYIRRKSFVEYDRPALIFLGVMGPSDNPCHFANVPIIDASLQFIDLGGAIHPNYDPQKIAGFVVAGPKYYAQPDKSFGVDWLRPHKGYYVLALINWERANDFRRYERQGYSMARVFLPHQERRRGCSRTSTSTPSTPSTPSAPPQFAYLMPTTIRRGSHGIFVKMVNRPFSINPFKKAQLIDTNIAFRDISLLARYAIKGGEITQTAWSKARSTTSWWCYWHCHHSMEEPNGKA